MEAYIFQAAWLCKSCGEKARADIKSDYPWANEGVLGSYDYPDGPYDMDYQEADTPQHCDWCDEFLENPLTSDGYKWLVEKVREYEVTPERFSPAIKTWKAFYHIATDEQVCVDCGA